MEEDGAKPMGMYCWDWGKMLAGVGADWEQPTGIRTAGQDSTAVSHLPAPESQFIAYSPSNYPLLHVFSACMWESSPATLN